jgi:hypothetical protein
MAVRVTEHQCQRVVCPGCGERQTARLPGAVAASAFGPRLQAAVVTLSVRNRVSRRDVVELCEQLFASRISTGTVDAILARTADALTEPCEDLLDRVRAARAVNMDETGWRLRGSQRTPTRLPQTSPSPLLVKRWTGPTVPPQKWGHCSTRSRCTPGSTLGTRRRTCSGKFLRLNASWLRYGAGVTARWLRWS